jgi:hypothetical protein
MKRSRRLNQTSRCHNKTSDARRLPKRKGSELFWGFLAGGSTMKQRERFSEIRNSRGTSVFLASTLASWLIDAKQSALLGSIPHSVELCICFLKRFQAADLGPSFTPENCELIRCPAAHCTQWLRGKLCQAILSLGPRRYHSSVAGCWCDAT